VVRDGWGAERVECTSTEQISWDQKRVGLIGGYPGILFLLSRDTVGLVLGTLSKGDC
jgi:hypothetical protein